jgi:hypothetical protein
MGLIKMSVKEYCIINVMFHDPGGRGMEWDESRTIIVNKRDFDKINNEIGKKITDGMIIDVESFVKYLDELDDRKFYYYEAVESFVHDVGGT